MDEPAAEPGEVERAGAVGCIGAVDGHPREQRTRDRRPGDERDARAPQIGPLTKRDQRGAVRSQHGRRERVREWQNGCDDCIGDPAPAAAPLEREHEEKRRQHDAEQPERVRACFAGGLDHTRVDGERQTGDEPAHPLEQHRAEDDEQPGRKRHGDRGRQPQRELAVPDRSGELEQQQPTCLAGIVVDDPRHHRAERALRGRLRMLPRRPSGSDARVRRHRVRAIRARRPRVRAARRARRTCPRVRQRRCPRSRVEATWGLGYPSRRSRAPGRRDEDQLPAAASAAWRCSLRNRSASSAAAHPEPAAVTACR